MSSLDNRDPLLVVLLGPTASGKTALSLSLAARFSGEIVSCDSVAVYREMEIGTAKPSHAERARIRHHLIDVVSPDQPYTAGDYSREARAALSDIVDRGHLPIVTGGTGLYLRALIDGLFPGPQRSEPLRDHLRRSERLRGPGWLHRILRRIDPALAGQIHANDEPKLIRAIEVTLAARQPMSQVWKTGRDRLTGYRVLRIGLDPDRAALYRRINATRGRDVSAWTGRGDARARRALWRGSAAADFAWLPAGIAGDQRRGWAGRRNHRPRNKVIATTPSGK